MFTVNSKRVIHIDVGRSSLLTNPETRITMYNTGSYTGFGMEGTVQRFIDHLEQEGKSKLTLKNYACDLRKMEKWLREEKGVNGISQVTPEIVHEFLEHLKYSEMAPSTRKRCRVVTKMFLDWCQSNSIIRPTKTQSKLLGWFNRKVGRANPQIKKTRLVEEAGRHFINTLSARGVSHTTTKNYSSDLSKLGRWWATHRGNKVVSRMNSRDIAEFGKYLRESGLAQSTIRRI